MHTDSVCFLVYLYIFTFIVGFLIWLFSFLVAGPEPSKKEPHIMGVLHLHGVLCSRLSARVPRHQSLGRS